MGEIADDIVNGLCCDICGEYFFSDENGFYVHGHPATCHECWRTLDSKEKKIHVMADVGTLP